jgi:hypothetical protein
VVSAESVLAALGLPAGTPLAWEPFGEAPGSPVRVFIEGAQPMELVVREAADAEARENHVAVSERLREAGYRWAPELLAIAGEATVERAVPGAAALQFVPPPGSAEAAMKALAALHALPLKEGLDWGRGPADLLPPGEFPLHRLGFSAAEREPARGPLLEAHDYLLASPFGFAHRNATAANVLLAPGQAWLCDFSAAGYGPQLWDVAAFLLTSGLEGPARRALAAAYAAQRDVSPDTAAELVDLLGILWGMHWLLELPRRFITNLGDDAVTDGLQLCAARIEKGMRQPAGDSPVARAIRRALWKVDA